MAWRRFAVTTAIMVFAAGFMPALAQAGVFKTDLTGFEEVPAISTEGMGQFMARLDHETGVVKYRLSYSDLEGDVRQAHIHFGQKGVNGGVSVFLCTNMDNAPADTPNPVQACPGPSTGMVEGMFEAGDVIGPDGQGISPGEFEAFLKALKSGMTYVNVHSTKWPGGEIRGQLDDHLPKFPPAKPKGPPFHPGPFR